MHYNGIIFDFNGTLFFDTDLHIQAWDTIAMRVVGEHMTKETLVQKYWGLANVDLIQRMTNNTLSTEECERLSAEKEALYRQYVKNDPSAQLAPGVIEFFNYLKQHNIPFTIASASIGLIDAILITRADTLDSAKVLAASTAGPTKAPQAIIVTSEPSTNVVDLPGTNV